MATHNKIGRLTERIETLVSRRTNETCCCRLLAASLLASKHFALAHRRRPHQPNPHSVGAAHAIQPAGSFFGGFRTTAGCQPHRRDGPSSETLHKVGLRAMSALGPLIPGSRTHGRHLSTSQSGPCMDGARGAREKNLTFRETIRVQSCIRPLNAAVVPLALM